MRTLGLSLASTFQKKKSHMAVPQICNLSAVSGEISGGILGTWWRASLVKSVSSVFSERHCLEKIIQQLIRTSDKHLFPPHAHACTYINTYACNKGGGGGRGRRGGGEGRWGRKRRRLIVVVVVVIVALCEMQNWAISWLLKWFLDYCCSQWDLMKGPQEILEYLCWAYLYKFFFFLIRCIFIKTYHMLSTVSLWGPTLWGRRSRQRSSFQCCLRDSQCTAWVRAPLMNGEIKSCFISYK